MTFEEELRAKHFEHICQQTNYFNDKLVDAFTSYVQTLSVIVGGCFWLALQDDAAKRIASAEILSDALVVLLSVVTVVRVVGNYTAWWGARQLQNAILDAVPAPHPVRSSWIEILLTLSVIFACGLFIRENPFALLKMM